MKDGLKLVLYNQCLYIKFDISHFSRCVLPSLYLYMTSLSSRWESLCTLPLAARVYFKLFATTITHSKVRIQHGEQRAERKMCQLWQSSAVNIIDGFWLREMTSPLGFRNQCFEVFFPPITQYVDKPLPILTLHHSVGCVSEEIHEISVPKNGGPVLSTQLHA